MNLRTRPNTTASRRGFSLVELVITMTIMTILVGVVSMRAGSMTNKARSAKITSLVDNLKTAVMMYHQDTNQLPREYNGYQGATFHRLSQDPGIDGWEGPYIETPINRTWNPAGGQVHLYPNARHAVNNDYDLDGDGTADVARPDACSISFWGVDEELAQKVNDALDEGLPGDWMNSGRVEYRSANRILSVMVYNP